MATVGQLTRNHDYLAMESSIRGNSFFILYSVEHGNLILYYDYPLVRMTVTQYTTLHLSFPVNDKLGKIEKKNYFLNLSGQIMFRHTCLFKPSV